VAGVLPRLYHPNRVWDSLAILTASSADPAAPVSWIKDQLRSKAWRSKLGWNIISDKNKFDFIDNGVAKVATLALNNYATGAALAAQLTTAMNAVAGITNTYLATYDSGTFKFTFARATGSNSFGIELSSPDAASCAKDVGFILGVDKTGATSYVADLAAYKSREWIKVNLGSALAVAAAVIANHNSGAGGTFTLQGHTSDAWTSPDVSQVLAGDAILRSAYFASATKQWWRVLIEDVQSSLGYSEVGIWYPSPYLSLTSFAPELTDEREELSDIGYAVNGAHFQTERQTRRSWELMFHNRSAADKAALIAILDAVKVGRNFFFDFDSANPQIRYTFFDRGLSFEAQETDPVTWSVKARLLEALG